MKIPYSFKSRIRKLINGLGFEIIPLRRLPTITEARLYRHYLGGQFDPKSSSTSGRTADPLRSRFTGSFLMRRFIRSSQSNRHSKC